MKKYNLVLFGVKDTTRILAEYLHRHGIKIDLIVSISPSVLCRNDVANYADLALTAEAIGATYHCVTDYSLNDANDSFFHECECNTGLVYGWQRLIPEHILNVFRVGIFGFHASPDLLPAGRGRSPLNWGLILGKTVLYNHCFKYATGADAGDIYSVTPFTVNEYDTIVTLLYKSLLTAKADVIRLIRDIQAECLQLRPQKGDSYFFPKRTPEDGLLDFMNSATHELVNLIRGVTRPFAGAFCYLGHDTKITIWEAWPFDNLLDFSGYQAGEVIDVLYNMPVIKTIDGSIILKNYEGATFKEHDLLHKGIIRKG